MHRHPWPPTRNLDLILLWAEGLSFWEISVVMDVSKNSVIGKCRRLKLPSRPQHRIAGILLAPRRKPVPVIPPRAPTSILPKTERDPVAGRGIMAAINNRLATAPRAEPDWDTRHSPAGGASTAVALLDAMPWHCRWPVSDDPDFKFCGQPICKVSYCSSHAKIAFNAPPPGKYRGPSW